MRNIYQEKRIDRLKTQGIEHEANTCKACSSTAPQHDRFMYRRHDAARSSGWGHDENMMEDPI